MKKNILRVLWSLFLLWIIYSLFLVGWNYITYAYETKQHQENILSTSTQIQRNSERWNEIYEQIKTLKQEQEKLKKENDELRRSLSKKKNELQEFLGFNSGM